MVIFLIFAPKKSPKNPDPEKPVAKEALKFYSPLTGRETSQEKTRRAVTAVMIENSPEARPQSGLKEAGVVFEAVAEGGITRFVALYQEAEPKLIGPVRSVRPYYLEWIKAFDPAVAHVGGSARALEMVRGGRYGVDLDQFFNDNAYWRASDRVAPHNVYTDFSHLSKLAKDKGKTESKFAGWPRETAKKSQQESDQKDSQTNAPKNSEIKNGEAETKNSAAKIALDVSSGTLFDVSYQYNSAKNQYLRNVGGAPHHDREKGQISPDVVIALVTAKGADGGYSTYRTTGRGTAYIFQNGEVKKAIWQKNSLDEQLQFLDEKSEEIKLIPGQVWITALGAANEVSWQ